MSQLKVTTFSSKGRASRIQSIKTGRIYHFHSDNQYRAFLIFERNDKVVDIQENVSLKDIMITIDNKEDLNFDRFKNKETGEIYEFFTNFVLTIKEDNKEYLVARTIKNTSELNRLITIERLEIERRYWKSKGIQWKVITEKELNRQLCKNIEWVRETLLGSKENLEVVRNKGEALKQFLLVNKRLLLKDCLGEFEALYALKTGEGLFTLRYLLATKDLKVDMKNKININEKIENLLEE